MIIFIMQLLFFLLLVAHPTLQFSVDRSSDDDCFCGLENTPPLSRILDGNVTAPNQYPWMVRLGGCGGSLISNRHVLTAHHCGFDKTVKVSTHHQYDENDYEEVAVEKRVYPDSKVTGAHDIAILVLAKPVSFDREIHPICLPTSDDFVWKGEKVTAMGWGQIYYSCGQSPKLKHTEVIVGDIHKNKNYFSTRWSTGTVACPGDSGGPVCHQDPVTKRWTIVGTAYLISYSGKICTHGSNVWNTVSSHLDWINKVLEETPNTVRCAPKVRPIIGKLINALATPSQQVQGAVANCLPPLTPSIKDEAPKLVGELLHTLLNTENFGERKGAAYGLAGLVKGLGILSLKQLDIMNQLTDALQNKKNHRHREGSLFALSQLCAMLGRP